MDEEMKVEVEKAKKIIETLQSLCAQLEIYEDRMNRHTTAISELQDFVLVDRSKIKKLHEKVNKLEEKFGKDVMYQ